MRLALLDNIRSIEHGRSLYHALAREHHPDRGGDPRLFQQLQDEWRFISQIEEFDPGYWENRHRAAEEPPGEPLPVRIPPPRREIPKPIMALLEQAGARVVEMVAAKAERRVVDGVMRIREWWERNEYDDVG